MPGVTAFIPDCPPAEIVNRVRRVNRGSTEDRHCAHGREISRVVLEAKREFVAAIIEHTKDET